MKPYPSNIIPGVTSFVYLDTIWSIQVLTKARVSDSFVGPYQCGTQGYVSISGRAAATYNIKHSVHELN